MNLLEFQIPVRWPASRDEVWKANIPHTHLAQEKSDQNWMVVNGDKINFPGGGTHFHDGADKYIVALSRVRNVDSFSVFVLKRQKEDRISDLVAIVFGQIK